MQCRHIDYCNAETFRHVVTHTLNVIFVVTGSQTTAILGATLGSVILILIVLLAVIMVQRRKMNMEKGNGPEEGDKTDGVNTTEDGRTLTKDDSPPSLASVRIVSTIVPC